MYNTFLLTGAQKFDVIWLHNNKEIKPSKDFEYTNEANIYKLNIAEIFPEDSGTYTCEAFNDAGESFSSCTLVVLGTFQNPHMFETVLPSADLSYLHICIMHLNFSLCMLYIFGIHNEVVSVPFSLSYVTCQSKISMEFLKITFSSLE